MQFSPNSHGSRKNATTYDTAVQKVKFEKNIPLQTNVSPIYKRVRKSNKKIFGKKNPGMDNHCIETIKCLTALGSTFC